MLFILPLLTFLNTNLMASTKCNGSRVQDCHTDPGSTGSNIFSVRDFREVMPGVLYRGGATLGKDRTALSTAQLKSLCEAGVGSAYYLYSKSIPTSKFSCSSGKQVDYDSMDWSKAPSTVNKQIYKSIHDGADPVFVHCWYGIHATGFVSATALIQFCGYSNNEAVAYWKVGIAPSLQYQKVIDKILAFERDPSLTLTPAEQDRVCPKK